MKPRGYLVEGVRSIVGLTFLLSGFIKAIDPVGVGIKVQEYQTNLFGIDVPYLLSLSDHVAIILIISEFLLGAFLLMGIYRKLMTRLTFVFMLFMTFLTAYSFTKGGIQDCGCFGDLITFTPLETLLKNIVLLGMSVYMLLKARTMRYLFSRRERWIPAILAVVGICYFIKVNYTDMPYVDFRPYKVGYNLREKIRIADSTYQAQLLANTRFIYKHDGVERSFAPDSLPDSTWHYVSMSQPDELNMHRLDYSFIILTSDGVDITEDMLADKKGVFLLLSSDWNNADQDNIDAINELYRYVRDQGYTFYSASPSAPESEAEWRYQTGAEYPSLLIDATTIRTIHRSNPGLFILKDGIIIDKVPSSLFPKVDDIPTFVQSRLEGQETTHPTHTRIYLLVVWAILLVVGISRRLIRHINVLRYTCAKQKYKQV